MYVAQGVDNRDYDSVGLVVVDARAADPATIPSNARTLAQSAFFPGAKPQTPRRRLSLPPSEYSSISEKIGSTSEDASEAMGAAASAVAKGRQSQDGATGSHASGLGQETTPRRGVQRIGLRYGSL
jgi:hypothetical protein